MIKLAAATAAALMLAIPAQAADVWASVMLRSYHSDRSHNYNEQNWGAGIEWEPEGSESYKIVAGGYKNSYNRPSFYVGAAWLPMQAGDFRIGAVGGAITGYRMFGHNFGPMVAGLVAYEKSDYGVNLLLMPPIPGDKQPTWVSAVQVKVKF